MSYSLKVCDGEKIGGLERVGKNREARKKSNTTFTPTDISVSKILGHFVQFFKKS